MFQRPSGRRANELREVVIQRHFTQSAPGSVLYRAGQTLVLCTASVEPAVPAWLVGRGQGWITAEYSMLPGSTSPRKRRERDKLDGRTSEIQRLIGRSLRAVADMTALGERTTAIDCDVLQADGGTRTASVNAALVAVVDTLRAVAEQLPDPARFPLTGSVAAVSVGMIGGSAVVDLEYAEDAAADVDMNVVMTGAGRFVELQGTAERTPIGDEDLAAMLALARAGIGQLSVLQRAALGESWPF
jgi:ribonuclease PH